MSINKTLYLKLLVENIPPELHSLAIKKVAEDASRWQHFLKESEFFQQYPPEVGSFWGNPDFYVCWAKALELESSYAKNLLEELVRPLFTVEEWHYHSSYDPDIKVTLSCLFAKASLSPKQKVLVAFNLLWSKLLGRDLINTFKRPIAVGTLSDRALLYFEIPGNLELPEKLKEAYVTLKKELDFPTPEEAETLIEECASFIQFLEEADEEQLEKELAETLGYEYSAFSEEELQKFYKEIEKEYSEKNDKG